mmetsp:Transcript_61895/g.191809  ORF Transcript_61895/g.191809 Transcript_61895/m.191809 type:complete len:289 (-) Transcript_61895:150-1016(-)
MAVELGEQRVVRLHRRVHGLRAERHHRGDLHPAGHLRHTGRVLSLHGRAKLHGPRPEVSGQGRGVRLRAGLLGRGSLPHYILRLHPQRLRLDGAGHRGDAGAWLLPAPRHVAQHDDHQPARQAQHLLRAVAHVVDVDLPGELHPLGHRLRLHLPPLARDPNGHLLGRLLLPLGDNGSDLHRVHGLGEHRVDCHIACGCQLHRHHDRGCDPQDTLVAQCRARDHMVLEPELRLDVVRVLGCRSRRPELDVRSLPHHPHRGAHLPPVLRLEQGRDIGGGREGALLVVAGP